MVAFELGTATARFGKEFLTSFVGVGGFGRLFVDAVMLFARQQRHAWLIFRVRLLKTLHTKAKLGNQLSKLGVGA